MATIESLATTYPSDVLTDRNNQYKNAHPVTKERITEVRRSLADCVTFLQFASDEDNFELYEELPESRKVIFYGVNKLRELKIDLAKYFSR